MAEHLLHDEGVSAILFHLVTTRVAQHVRVDREGHTGVLAERVHEVAQTALREGRFPLASEYKARRHEFSLQLLPRLKRAHGVHFERLVAISPILYSTDSDLGIRHIALVPAQSAQFDRAKRVAKHHLDERAIPDGLPSGASGAGPASRFYQPFDLCLSEIFPGAIVEIFESTARFRTIGVIFDN